MLQITITILAVVLLFLGGVRLARASGVSCLIPNSSSSYTMPASKTNLSGEIPEGISPSEGIVAVPYYSAEYPPSEGIVAVPYYSAEYPKDLIIKKGDISWRIPQCVAATKYSDLFIKPNEQVRASKVIELCDGWKINVDVGVKNYSDIVKENGLVESNFKNYPDLFIPVKNK